MRLITAPVAQRRPYVVQVAAPLGELERGLDEFVLALMAALPLTLLVAYV